MLVFGELWSVTRPCRRRSPLDHSLDAEFRRSNVAAALVDHLVSLLRPAPPSPLSQADTRTILPSLPRRVSATSPSWNFYVICILYFYLMMPRRRMATTALRCFLCSPVDQPAEGLLELRQMTQGHNFVEDYGHGLTRREQAAEVFSSSIRTSSTRTKTCLRRRKTRTRCRQISRSCRRSRPLSKRSNRYGTRCRIKRGRSLDGGRRQVSWRSQIRFGSSCGRRFRRVGTPLKMQQDASLSF